MFCEGGSCVLKYVRRWAGNFLLPAASAMQLGDAKADEEGDLCTLAPTTFVDFLEQCIPQLRHGCARL